MWSAKKKENNLIYSSVVLERKALHFMPEISALNIRNATKIKAQHILIDINQIFANFLMKMFVGNQIHKYCDIKEPQLSIGL